MGGVPSAAAVPCTAVSRSDGCLLGGTKRAGAAAGGGQHHPLPGPAAAAAVVEVERPARVPLQQRLTQPDQSAFWPTLQLPVARMKVEAPLR